MSTRCLKKGTGSGERGRGSVENRNGGVRMEKKEKERLNDYEKLYREFKREVPEYYNFGFEVIDKWAQDRTKLALVSLDRSLQVHEDHRIREGVPHDRLRKDHEERTAGTRVTPDLQNIGEVTLMVPGRPGENPARWAASAWWGSAPPWSVP